MRSTSLVAPAYGGFLPEWPDPERFHVVRTYARHPFGVHRVGIGRNSRHPTLGRVSLSVSIDSETLPGARA
jgi:hypothetical protein